MARGYNAAPATCSIAITNALKKSIIEYQKDNNLVVGKLTIELFNLLGIELPSEFVNEYLVLNDSISLVYQIESFKTQSHELDTCEKGAGWARICTIDGEDWFGTKDGYEPPTSEFKILLLLINEKLYKLETSGMYNVHPNSSASSSWQISKRKNDFLLSAGFSNGAGYYMATWEIKNGVSNRILLSRDEEDF